MPRPHKTTVIATNAKTGEVLNFPGIREAAKNGFTYSSVRNALRTGHTHAGFTFKSCGQMRPLKADNLINRVATLRNSGLTNPQIAARLEITISTVGCYGSIAHKMGLTKTFAEVQEDIECDGKF